MNPWKIPEHFTPGPWALKYGVPCVVLPANESHPRRAAIAQCALSHGIGLARVEDEANARLIACSPDLLAALCALVVRCDGAEGVRADGSNIDTSAAHAAIDKALGEPTEPKLMKTITKPEAHPFYPSVCRGSWEQVENRHVSLDGEIACAECGRVLRASKHPGSRRYAIVPRHNLAARAGKDAA